MKEPIKVVVTDYIEADLEWEAKEIRGLGLEFEAFQLKFAPEAELAKATRDAHVIIANMAPITASLVAKWEKCSLLIRHGIGYDNVDVDAVTSRGIRFANIPDYCPQEVAEQAIALIFALGRKVVFSRKILEDCSRHHRWEFTGLEPIHQMKGQTLGIIGCGRIGSRVYLGLRSFGFKFLICDPYLTPERIEELGIELVDHETVYRGADFITMHTPLTSETRHMINERSLAMMKPSAYLINTSRAGVIDHDALYQALKNGRISGAAIDVFFPEPPPPDNPLFTLENVVLTPHMSWYSVESGWEIRRKILEQLRRFRDGLPPLNWINEDELSREARA